MSRTGAKTISLGAATSLLAWSTQQLALGNLHVGATGTLLSLLILAAYQLAEETDHASEYAQLLESINDDTLQRLAETSADELNNALDDHTEEE